MGPTKKRGARAPAQAAPSEPAAIWESIGNLRGWAANPRKNAENVERVAESIKRFGFSAPIVARRNGEVIAGHTRLAAARALGIDQVPVRYLDLSEREAHLLALADNRLTELSPWDTDALHEILAAYDAADITLAGWSQAEFDALVDAPAEADDGSSDELPDPPKDPIVKLGDVWQLGRHVLSCSDAREADPSALLGEAVNTCVTDPPYGIGADSEMSKQSGSQYGRAAAKKRHYADVGWDKDPPIDFVQSLASYAQAIIFGGNYFGLPASSCWLVWDKQNDGNAFADAELAWTNLGKAVRIKRHLWNGMLRKDREERFSHPTQKPVDVIKWCIEMTAGPVFDPFLGSGTTIIAAEKLGRVCVGTELHPAYCDLIIERWQNLTGQKASLRG